MAAEALSRRTVYLVLLLLALLPMLMACTIQPTPAIYKIALLAPFEGRYREVGYDALYAARLALAEANVTQIELLAVDVGGTTARAVDRAQALAQDPAVLTAIAVGFAAADAETQVAFTDIPIIVAGNWGAQPVGAETFLLTRFSDDSATDALFYVGARVLNETPVQDWVSSAAPPDADFSARYQATDSFAPPPTPLATLVYDATRMAILATANGTTRTSVAHALDQ
ncbi:MAG: ABC transporter substrate-binding protein, partial [Anaerolineae bacterium]|nr:ABC transporter substrate-binding protein [Anaerolineae bacterium]